MKYCFNIDEKSLYRGVKNDYKRGQSATVHTPLNQSKDRNRWRNDIYAFINGYKSLDIDTLPHLLKEKCLKKTTSKASTKVVNFYVFSNFALDGVPFKAEASFAMFVKEEIDKTIIQRGGLLGQNTHLGRQKLHYPISFYHITDGYNIDNKTVLDKILEVNGGFAYVVNEFEVDTETDTLNFKTTMIGQEGVFLSNVFKRGKGVGVKLLIDDISLSENDFASKTGGILTSQENEFFITTLEKIQESSRLNGNIGEQYVYEHLEAIIKDKTEEKVHISKKYPKSPYDIECIVKGEKLFIEVKSTGHSKKMFYMSKGERKFMDKYKSHYLLILVTNVRSSHKKHFKYKPEDLENSKIIEKEYQDIKFIVK